MPLTKAEKVKLWKQRNPEKVREQHRRYRARHPGYHDWRRQERSKTNETALRTYRAYLARKQRQRRRRSALRRADYLKPHSLRVVLVPLQRMAQFRSRPFERCRAQLQRLHRQSNRRVSPTVRKEIKRREEEARWRKQQQREQRQQQQQCEQRQQRKQQQREQMQQQREPRRNQQREQKRQCEQQQQQQPQQPREPQRQRQRESQHLTPLGPSHWFVDRTMPPGLGVLGCRYAWIPRLPYLCDEEEEEAFQRLIAPPPPLRVLPPRRCRPLCLREEDFDEDEDEDEDHWVEAWMERRKRVRQEGQARVTARLREEQRIDAIVSEMTTTNAIDPHNHLPRFAAQLEREFSSPVEEILIDDELFDSIYRWSQDFDFTYDEGDAN